MTTHRGQAMVETMLAVLFVSFVLYTLFTLSRRVTARVLLDHASARAARARAVGFNEYMCLKSARVAMIPVAGKLLWPNFSDFEEVSRIPMYLATAEEQEARGVLEYEGWGRMRLWLSDAGDACEASVRLHDEAFDADGRASIESHSPLFLNDFGL